MKTRWCQRGCASRCVGTVGSVGPPEAGVCAGPRGTRSGSALGGRQELPACERAPSRLRHPWAVGVGPSPRPARRAGLTWTAPPAWTWRSPGCDAPRARGECGPAARAASGCTWGSVAGQAGGGGRGRDGDRGGQGERPVVSRTAEGGMLRAGKEAEGGPVSAQGPRGRAQRGHCLSGLGTLPGSGLGPEPRARGPPNERRAWGGSGWGDRSPAFPNCLLTAGGWS